jgi:hypothetical protein
VVGLAPGGVVSSTVTITASLPLLNPPTWAVLQRKLIEVMSESVSVFLRAYTHQHGPRQHELIWGDVLHGRDGADDFYEAFYNWPLLYLLGGDDELLPLAHQQWEATTRQLTRLGLVHKEYERGYDQFHQCESYIYFYLLCLADPTHPKLIERARRFAGFYLNEDPEAQNYDAEKNIIRAPHNGSGGPRWGLSDEGPTPYGYSPGMAVYGLPFNDLTGITHIEDLRDPINAQTMGQAMYARMGQGDVAANLGVSSLIANAYLLTSDDKYKRWLLRYVEGWIQRAAANSDLLPDNVGLSGQVGEAVNGNWFGGLYGWSWPHGFYNLQAAALVAAQSCLLLTNNSRYLDLPRKQQDRILALGEMRNAQAEPMSLRHHWAGQRHALESADKTFLVPYRFDGNRWFDYQPLSPIYPAALWTMSASDDDWAHLQALRTKENYDWCDVHAFRTKEDAGHEQPWLEFLAGRNPGYPEAILREAYGQVCWRLDRIRADDADLMRVNIHHWQERNPVTTEALVQLTLGAPQIIYNGGLLVAPVRYFDGERGRPGLPRDVAALVTGVTQHAISISLVNLSLIEERCLLIQAGSFGEHRFTEVRYSRQANDSDYPRANARYDYGAGEVSPPDPFPTEYAISVHKTHLQVNLPPGTLMNLQLHLERYVNSASYRPSAG